MSNNPQGLSTKCRFFVIACTPPAFHGVLLARKKGYISFLQECNALTFAKNHANANPGTRVYVTRLVDGALVPSPDMQVATY